MVSGKYWFSDGLCDVLFAFGLLGRGSGRMGPFGASQVLRALAASFSGQPLFELLFILVAAPRKMSNSSK